MVGCGCEGRQTPASDCQRLGPASLAFWGLFAGSPGWAVLPMLAFGASRADELGAGERERGVVGGVEELEVREAVGEPDDDPACGAHHPARHAEQDPPQRLGVAAQRRVLGGGVAGRAGGGADVAHPRGDVQG
jgi:hypothetical protein